MAKTDQLDLIQIEDEIRKHQEMAIEEKNLSAVDSFQAIRFHIRKVLRTKGVTPDADTQAPRS